MLRVLLYSGLTAGFGARKTPSGQRQIGKSEQGKGLRSVLVESAIAVFIWRVRATYTSSMRQSDRLATGPSTFG